MGGEVAIVTESREFVRGWSLDEAVVGEMVGCRLKSCRGKLHWSSSKVEAASEAQWAFSRKKRPLGGLSFRQRCPRSRSHASGVNHRLL